MFKYRKPSANQTLRERDKYINDTTLSVCASLKQVCEYTTNTQDDDRHSSHQAKKKKKSLIPLLPNITTN